jgi:hypothetical protein
MPGFQRRCSGRIGNTLRVSSSGIRGSVDLFDDPPWTSSPAAADPHQGRRSAIAALGLCLLGAVGVAISTTLPWFGLDESLGVGFLRLQDQMSALSRYLQPAGFGSFSPGTQEWGFLILALSCGVAMSAIMTVAMPLIGRRTPFGLYLVLAVLALLLVIASVLDAHAKPPFGDGPPLRFSWGAVVGVAAATTSLIGACSALILRR